MAALREALPPLPITWADNRGNQGRSVGFTADGRPVTSNPGCCRRQAALEIAQRLPNSSTLITEPSFGRSSR